MLPVFRKEIPTLEVQSILLLNVLSLALANVLASRVIERGRLRRYKLLMFLQETRRIGEK